MASRRFLPVKSACCTASAVKLPLNPISPAAVVKGVPVVVAVQGSVASWAASN